MVRKALYGIWLGKEWSPGNINFQLLHENLIICIIAFPEQFYAESFFTSPHNLPATLIRVIVQIWQGNGEHFSHRQQVPGRYKQSALTVIFESAFVKSDL